MKSFLLSALVVIAFSVSSLAQVANANEGEGPGNLTSKVFTKKKNFRYGELCLGNSDCRTSHLEIELKTKCLEAGYEQCTVVVSERVITDENPNDMFCGRFTKG